MLSPAVVAWLEFSLCVTLIGMGGTALSRYGDVIADKTGLSGTWAGLLLLGIYLLNSFVLYLHGT